MYVLLASRKIELFSLLISHSLDRTRCSCTFWNLIFRRFNDFSLVIVWAPFELLLFKKSRSTSTAKKLVEIGLEIIFLCEKKVFLSFHHNLNPTTLLGDFDSHLHSISHKDARVFDNWLDYLHFFSLLQARHMLKHTHTHDPMSWDHQLAKSDGKWARPRLTGERVKQQLFLFPTIIFTL